MLDYYQITITHQTIATIYHPAVGNGAYRLP